MSFYIALFIFAYTSVALFLIVCRIIARHGENRRLRERGLAHEVANWSFISAIGVVWLASGLATLLA